MINALDSNFCVCALLLNTNIHERFQEQRMLERGVEKEKKGVREEENREMEEEERGARGMLVLSCELG